MHCFFHFVAPVALSYFTMGSSAGHSPFRVASPPCPCLRRLVCLSISPSVLALLSWHHFFILSYPCSGVSPALASSPVSPWFFDILGVVMSLVSPAERLSFQCLLAGFRYVVLPRCYALSWLSMVMNGSILFKPAVTSTVQSVTPPTRVTTAAPLLPKPCWLR